MVDWLSGSALMVSINIRRKLYPPNLPPNFIEAIISRNSSTACGASNKASTISAAILRTSDLSIVEQLTSSSDELQNSLSCYVVNQNLICFILDLLQAVFCYFLLTI